MSPLPIEPFDSDAELVELVSAFENGTLPRKDWTHRAHLAMAAWYLSKHPQPIATELVRAGILKLNRAHGTVNDADHGYHETITLFYTAAIAHCLSMLDRNGSLLTAVNTLLTTHGHKELPFEYYSRARLLSREARARWIEPDLKPFTWQVNHQAQDG